jgi:hypothetical protein
MVAMTRTHNAQHPSLSLYFLQEVDDRMVLLGFSVTLGLNSILFLQMICYWNSGRPKAKAE